MSRHSEAAIRRKGIESMTAASKQPAQIKEPIPERGVLPSVQRTISRYDSDPLQKIMALQIGGSMVNNSLENVVARAQLDDDERRAETRHSSGTLPRSMAAIAAGLGTGAGSSRRVNRNDALDKKGVSLCSSERANGKMRRVDFGDAIGKELQNLYDDLVAQPVPDRFLNLLNQLEKNVVSSGLSSSAPGERE